MDQGTVDDEIYQNLWMIILFMTFFSTFFVGGFLLFEIVYLNSTGFNVFFFSFAGIDLCMLRLEMTFKVEKAIHQSMKVMIRPVR